MTSACLSQYARPFGGEVLGKGFPFPGLDVCNVIALKTSPEVYLAGVFEVSELRLQRQHEDEASVFHRADGFLDAQGQRRGAVPLLYSERRRERREDDGEPSLYLSGASELQQGPHAGGWHTG